MSDSQQRIEESVEELIDQIDELLLQGKFRKVDDILDHSEPALLHTAQIIALLSVTDLAKGDLRNRKNFYERALDSVRSRSLVDQRDIEDFA